MNKTKIAWVIITEHGYMIDTGFDVDDYLTELKKILKKVDFEVVSGCAVFRSKGRAEKYLKRLDLQCETKIVKVEIKILSK